LNGIPFTLLLYYRGPLEPGKKGGRSGEREVGLEEKRTLTGHNFTSNLIHSRWPPTKEGKRSLSFENKEGKKKKHESEVGLSVYSPTREKKSLKKHLL